MLKNISLINWIKIILIMCIAQPVAALNNTQLGIIEILDDQAYLYTDSPVPDTIHSLQLQYPDTEQNVQCCITLFTPQISQPVQIEEPVADQLYAHPIYRYPLYLAIYPRNITFFVGTAIINAQKIQVIQQDKYGERLLITDDQGETLTINLCLSNNGLNVVGKRENRLTDWLYYWLNYDTEPTCPAELFELH